MMRFIPLLILAGVGAEIASIIWVGGLLGILPAILLLFASGFMGITLIKSAGAGMAQALRAPVRGASLQRGLASRAVARITAGLLFLIPGFFTDVLGLLLLLPPVRAWLAARIPVREAPASGMQQQRYDNVIEAEAIEITGEMEPPPRHHTEPGKPE